MGFLLDLQEYLEKNYRASIFDSAFESQEPWELHLHNHRIVQTKILENLRYDLKLSTGETGEGLVPKTDVSVFLEEGLVVVRLLALVVRRASAAVRSPEKARGTADATDYLK